MKKKVIITGTVIFAVLLVLGIGLESSSNSDDSTKTATVNDTYNDIADDSVQNGAEAVESDENAVQAIKEGHYSEYPSQPIGEAFDRFFENTQWTSSSTTVTFVGDYQDAEGKKTIGIQYELDSSTGRYRYSSMSIGGTIDKKGSNVASGVQYPQMMRAVFDEQEVPVVELSENDASDIKGMWIAKPMGQDMYSTEVIFIKDVNDDVIEFETAYCVAYIDSGWTWMIARSDEGTSSLTSSDVSGVKCFYADGENVYVDDGVLYYGYYGNDNMKMYKTSFCSLEEVIMYYRSDYDVDSLRDNKDDTGFVIANPIKTYMDEFVEVIPSEYDRLDTEWHKKTNYFEYVNEYERLDSVTFYDAGNGLMGISYRYTYDDTDETEQNRLFIDTAQYDVNEKNGIVYQILEYQPIESPDYMDADYDEAYEENYGYEGHPGFYKVEDSYITYYSKSIDFDARIIIQIDIGLGQFSLMNGSMLFDGGQRNIDVPSIDFDATANLYDEAKVNLEEQESDRSPIIQESPQSGETIDIKWYKSYSHFQSAAGTDLEIVYYDDGYFELAFDGLTADSMYYEYDFDSENGGSCLYYKADEGIRFRYYPSKKIIEVVDAPYDGEYECMD